MDLIVYDDWIERWLRQFIDRPLLTYLYTQPAFALLLSPNAVQLMFKCITFRRKSQVNNLLLFGSF